MDVQSGCGGPSLYLLLLSVSDLVPQYLHILGEFQHAHMTLWHESASELYRLSDRRLSAKLVPTFADRW
jgi:hypothetical protein